MKKTAIRKLVKTSIAFFFIIFIALGNISLKAQQSATGLSQNEARELWEQRQFEVAFRQDHFDFQENFKTF